MNPKVLLTGSTGFVGSQILLQLLKRDIYVRSVVRETKKSLPNTSRLPGDVVYTKDMFNESYQWWLAACSGIDIIIHSAWYVEPGKYLESPLNQVCVDGTLEMARGAVGAGVSRFVGIGTCFEYDTSCGLLSINTPLLPTTRYAIAKVSALEKLSRLFITNNIEFAWCRLFFLYGEGEDSRRLVPTLHKKLALGEEVPLTEGNQIRDYMNVEEAGKRIVDVALGEILGPVNICSGIPVTVRQLAENIASKYEGKDLLKFGARQNNILDPPCIIGVQNEI
jgi:nucleoside-diphosphate-sugar epimerase